MGRGKFLRHLATEVLGEELARKVWGRIEIIGDIAVIRKPFDVELKYLVPLAKALLKRLPYVKSVWASVSAVEGEYRLRKYVHLAGERRSETIYREHGCLFKVDITKVYISPTLNYEHLRVAKQVRPGEFIINMFAGAGLFSVIIAKLSRPSKVVSIDINPYAYGLMKENIKLNKVGDVVEPILGDAKDIVLNFESIADRVLMPLPELAYRYFPYAVKALKDSGIVHVYEFDKGSSKGEVMEKVWSKYEYLGRELEINLELLSSRIVRSVGPKRWQVVLDLRVKKP